jgi:hypothetical protein
MAGKKQSNTPSTAGPGSVTPELEVVWARAVSRAADDAAFRERLENDPNAALSEFGLQIPDDVGLTRDLTPSLPAALAAIERQRILLAAAVMPSACGGASASAQGAGSAQGGGGFSRRVLVRRRAAVAP